MFKFVRLNGGPLDGQDSEMWEPGETIDAGVPDGLYVRHPDDDTQYTWAEGIKPEATVLMPDPMPLPDGVRTHLQHLRDYLAKDPAQITNAESVHAIKDLIRAVHFLNSRFETEG